MKEELSLTEERELLTRLQQGDTIAFEELYHRYKSKLANNLFRLLKSWDLVEEILQEMFVKLWDNREKIDPNAAFSAYLYRVSTNLVYDYYRKVSTTRKKADELWLHLYALYETENLQEQIQADAELLRVIELLPPQRKTVFKLCKLEGKSYSEVSRLLSISESAINNHITKANRFLRDNYKQSIPILLIWFCQQIIRDL